MKKEGDMGIPKIGIIFPPEFWRLPLQIGAMRRYFDEQKSKDLPMPHVFIGSSAGGIAAACSVAWTENNFTYLQRIIRNLKSEQIYKSTLRDKMAGTFLIADSAFHFLTSGEKLPWWKKIMCASGSLGAKIGVVYEMLKAPSVFSNEPLLNLLRKNLDFKAIFNSPIRLEILTMDKETREKIVYTNYLENDKNPKRLIDGLAGTSALPLIFPCRKDGEKLMVDGAVHPMNTMPFYRVLENNCDIVIVLQFAPFNNKDLVGSMAGLSVVNQCFNITTSEIGSIMLRGFINRNQDLKITNNIRIALTKLKKTAQGNFGFLGSVAKQKILLEIKKLEEICSEFSFIEMKSVETLVVTVANPKLLPPMSIQNFKAGETAKLIEMGYTAMGPILNQLENLLKTKPAL